MTDPFAAVLGAGRGLPAGDPEGARPKFAHPISFPRSASGSGPRTVAEILSALTPFADDWPLYMQDIEREHTLEGAGRISGGHTEKRGNGEVHFCPEIGPGPTAYATVGAFRKLLVSQDWQRKVWFQPPPPSLGETLVAYMLFADRCGQQSLSLITVY